MVSFLASCAVLLLKTEHAVPVWSENIRPLEFITCAIEFGVYKKPVKNCMATDKVQAESDTAGLQGRLMDSNGTKRLLGSTYLQPELCGGSNSNLPSSFPISDAFVIRQAQKRRLVVNCQAN